MQCESKNDLRYLPGLTRRSPTLGFLQSRCCGRVSQLEKKAPASRTHSKRFAIFDSVALRDSVWSAEACSRFSRNQKLDIGHWKLVIPRILAHRFGLSSLASRKLTRDLHISLRQAR